MELTINATEWIGDVAEDNSTSYSYLYNYPDETVVENGVILYIFPILLLLASLTNTVSVFILYRLSRQVLSTCVYLALLAVLDLLVLYSRCGNEWFTKLTGHDLSIMLMVYSTSVCKAYPFAFSFTFHLARWLLVAVAIEGVIGTIYPTKLYIMCTLSRARAIIMLLTVLLVCFNAHYFWSYDLTPVPEGDGLWCTYVKYGQQYKEEFHTIIWPILDMSLAELIPHAVAVICAIIMASSIVRGRHLGSHQYRKWRRRYICDPEAVDQLQMTFCILCLLHVFLTVPKLVAIIYKYVYEKQNSKNEYDLLFEARFNLADTLCSMLDYMFRSGKPVLYLVSSRRFRRELIRILRNCYCRNVDYIR